MLPETPYGKGVREIKAPMVLDVNACEGMLVRNPKDTAEWGIFYNGKANPERQRFTVPQLAAVPVATARFQCSLRTPTRRFWRSARSVGVHSFSALTSCVNTKGDALPLPLK